MELLSVLAKFALVFFMSLIFGLQRQRSHKPIGFGTFVFVSVGACGLAITAELINLENPMPLLAAIVTGIGFLGAGALIKTTDKIFGFTSAASIWIFAIIGLIIGAGYYAIGLIMYSTIWIVAVIDKTLENRGTGSYQKKLIVTTNKNVHTGEMAALLDIEEYKIMSIDVHRKDGKFTFHMLVNGTKENLNQIPKKLLKSKWVDTFRIE